MGESVSKSRLAIAQGGDIIRRRFLDNCGQRQHFQRVADGVDFLHVGNRERADDHAAPLYILYQPVALQLPQGFTQRRAADVQAVGIFCLDDALASGNFPSDNGVLEHFVGDFTNRAAFHHGLEGDGCHSEQLLVGGLESAAFVSFLVNTFADAKCILFALCIQE